MRAILLSLLFLAWAVPSGAAIVRVSSLDALTKAVASAKAGDEVVLQDGSYTASGTFVLSSSAGTATQPVVVRANTIGGATIRGTAAVVVDRSAYLDLQGFRFRFTALADKGVQVKGSHHIGILDNHFELAEAAATKNYWLMIDGALADGSAPHHITIARNAFWNKSQEGCFLVVYGTSSPYQVAKQVRIEGNHFKGHSFTGSNGGEAIRFGDSNRQNDISDSQVKGNLFEQCDGDVEVLSVKTTRLRVEGNTLRDNVGSIVLRHGDSCIVTGNFLIGNHGGIRIYGDHQMVIGNYLEGNTNTKSDGSVSGSYATLGIGMGSQADLANGENTYDQPSHGVVAFNTLVNNNSRGLEIVQIKTETMAPSKMAILNNVLVSDKSTLSQFAVPPVDAQIAGNLLYGKATKGDLAAAFTFDPKFVRGADSLLRPDPTSTVVDAALPSAALPSWYLLDMDGQTRQKGFDLGADEVSSATSLSHPLRASEVGPRVGLTVAVSRPGEGASSLPFQGAVDLQILAVDGRLVRSVRLDASKVQDHVRVCLRSGVYTARIQQGAVQESRIILVP